MVRFQHFLFKLNFEYFILYQFYIGDIVSDDSIVDNISDYSGEGLVFNSPEGKNLSLSFLLLYITLLYHFLAKPGTIQISNSKLDLVRYSQFLCEKKIECK
jgi:hypothetical protein